MAAPLEAPTPDVAKAARDAVMSDAKANRNNSGSAHPSQASATTPEARVALAEPPDAVTWPSALHVLAYQRDVIERTILFFDTLRRRANVMLEHEQAGLPPLLSFKYETLLDGRGLEQPANYALLRITEVGDACWDDWAAASDDPMQSDAAATIVRLKRGGLVRMGSLSILLIGDDPSVTEANDSLGIGSDHWLVRDEHNGHAASMKVTK